MPVPQTDLSIAQFFYQCEIRVAPEPIWPITGRAILKGDVKDPDAWICRFDYEYALCFKTRDGIRRLSGAEQLSDVLAIVNKEAKYAEKEARRVYAFGRRRPARPRP